MQRQLTFYQKRINFLMKGHSSSKGVGDKLTNVMQQIMKKSNEYQRQVKKRNQEINKHKKKIVELELKISQLKRQLDKARGQQEKKEPTEENDLQNEQNNEQSQVSLLNSLTNFEIPSSLEFRTNQLKMEYSSKVGIIIQRHAERYYGAGREGVRAAGDRD